MRQCLGSPDMPRAPREGGGGAGREQGEPGLAVLWGEDGPAGGTGVHPGCTALSLSPPCIPNLQGHSIQGSSWPSASHVASLSRNVFVSASVSTHWGVGLVVDRTPASPWC